MPTIKALVIPCDEDQDIHVIEFEQGDSSRIREVVGGWFGASEGREIPITFWYNDQGKIDDLNMNTRATCMWWSADRRFLSFDYIAGDALITGLADDEGLTGGCPDDFIDLVLHKECGFSLQAHGQDVRSRSTDSYTMQLLRAITLAQNNGAVTGIKVFAAS